MSKYVIIHEGQVLHDSSADDEKLRVLDPVYKPVMGKAGELTFRIAPKHPAYNAIVKFASEISLYIDGDWEWSGRVLDDEKDFQNFKKIEVEGELSYFNDTVVRPYDREGGSVASYLDFFIENHNAQVKPERHFHRGLVTVTNSTDNLVRGSSSYPTSWEEMSEKMTGNAGLGGYFKTRRYDGKRYLDYVENYGSINEQVITFGSNLLDLSEYVKGSEIATAIIPLGARQEDEQTSTGGDVRLTIESVEENGLDYVWDQETVNIYGWIFQTHVWDDVTVPLNLLTRGQEKLAQQRLLGITLDVDAVDLSLIDVNIERIRCGDLIRIVSTPHNIDDYLTVESMSVDLADPANTAMSLGSKRTALTEEIGRDLRNTLEKVTARYVTNERLVDRIDDVITTVTQEYSSMIEQTAEAITLEVSETYATKSALGEESQTRQSQYEQTAEDITLKFQEANQYTETVEGVVTDNREELETYVRFNTSGITLGKIGDPFTITIDNSQIAFRQGGSRAAYIQNNKLYMPEGVITGGTVQSSASIYGSGSNGGWRLTSTSNGGGMVDVTNSSGTRVFRAGPDGAEIRGQVTATSMDLSGELRVGGNGEGGILPAGSRTRLVGRTPLTSSGEDTVVYGQTGARQNATSDGHKMETIVYEVPSISGARVPIVSSHTAEGLGHSIIAGTMLRQAGQFRISTYPMGGGLSFQYWIYYMAFWGEPPNSVVN